MSQVIQIDSLGKRYTLGAQGERYSALRDSIARRLRNLVPAPPRRGPRREHSRICGRYAMFRFPSRPARWLV